MQKSSITISNGIVSKAPKDNEIEVSLFGTGYGESILVHLGDKKWLLVDSCTQAKNSAPLPLEYLQSLTKKSGQTHSIVLIVASHWHDDHIRGLSKIIKHEPKAKFALPSALNKKEFLSLASLGAKTSILQSSGVQEFRKILNIIKEKKQKNRMRFAIENRVLFENQDLSAKITALSPSDQAMEKAFSEIASLLAETEENPNRKKASASSPNHFAIALHVKIKGISLLLGSDLEEKGALKGWTLIVENDVESAKSKSSVFKVPHHGSQNAHLDKVWKELLMPQPYAILTPFHRGSVFLPKGKDLKRLKGYTDRLFCTQGIEEEETNFKSKAVQHDVRQATKVIRSIPQKKGHIRLRIKKNADPKNWNVKLFDEAVKL